MKTAARMLAALALALALDGCSDTVRKEYRTLDEVKSANAFDQGWIPPRLPEGATDIVEVDDLDTNCGTGTFRFPPESIPRYLETLNSEFGSKVTKGPAGLSIVVSNGSVQWDIALAPDKGAGCYSVKPLGQ